MSLKSAKNQVYNSNRHVAGSLAMLLTLCGLTALAQAEPIYRWVDAGGQIHYGSQPPAKTTQFKAVPVPAIPIQPAATTAPTNSAANANQPRTVDPMRMSELQTQLQAAGEELQMATQAYNNAASVRMANERNYAKYLSRISPFADKVSAAQIRAMQIREQIQTLSQAAGANPTPE